MGFKSFGLVIACVPCLRNRPLNQSYNPLPTPHPRQVRLLLLFLNLPFVEKSRVFFCKLRRKNTTLKLKRRDLKAQDMKRAYSHSFLLFYSIKHLIPRLVLQFARITAPRIEARVAAGGAAGLAAPCEPRQSLARGGRFGPG